MHFAAFFFAVGGWILFAGAGALVGFRTSSAVTLVIALISGGFAGNVLWQNVHGETYDAVWSAPPDRPSSLRGKGAWTTGNAIVRVRSDGAIGYGLADGAKKWAFQAPGAQVVCAMSESADRAVGLLAYGREGAACEDVAAVDLGTGKGLWTSRVVQTTRTRQPDARGAIAATGDVAVLPAGKGLRGLDLRTGKARWAWNPPKGCAFVQGLNNLTASDKAIALTLWCGSDKYGAAVVDPGTGASRWATRLPTSAKVETAAVVSADPVVVHTKEGGERGTDQIVTFTPEGRQRAAFPTSTGNGDLEVTRTGFGGKPVSALQVQKDVIVSAVKGNREYSFERDIVGLTLEGRELWRVELGGGVNGLFTTSETVAVLNSRTLGDASQLTVLSINTGETIQQATLTMAAPENGLLLAASSYYLIVQDGEESDSAPVTVFHR
ncbi:PQQ-binding-like beta-propeller repeat protein [Actinomadura sp. BRA 177]|nr:PQQ-binding-like beta-propeller repeat protein [Actinomadura sp. BRA 177]